MSTLKNAVSLILQLAGSIAMNATKYDPVSEYVYVGFAAVDVPPSPKIHSC